MIRREVLPHVTRREALADGVAFEFEYTSAMHKTLDDLVAFERECCSGLTWNSSRPTGRVLRLSVQGLAADSDFFRALEGGATNAPVRGHLARLVLATGLGAGVALFLCCVVPIGIASMGAVAVAAQFAKLDHPLVIVGASAVSTMPVWFWLRRRVARSEGAYPDRGPLIAVASSTARPRGRS